MRVLIVEDDEVVQGVLCAYLKHYAAEQGDSMDIEQMTDAGRALTRLHMPQDIFDVVFLDVRMPQLGGDEIYSQMMRIRPDMIDRIIFITGYRDDIQSRFPGLQLNILDKPFRYHQLIEAMAAIG